MATGWSGGGVLDAHRHLGVLPAHPFHGGPPVDPGTTAVPDVESLLRATAAEVERRGTGHDRVLCASDEPWGDAGDLARPRGAAGDGEPARPWLTENSPALHGRGSTTHRTTRRTDPRSPR